MYLSITSHQLEHRHLHSGSPARTMISNRNARACLPWKMMEPLRWCCPWNIMERLFQQAKPAMGSTGVILSPLNSPAAWFTIFWCPVIRHTGVLDTWAPSGAVFFPPKKNRMAMDGSSHPQLWILGQQKNECSGRNGNFPCCSLPSGND